MADVHSLITRVAEATGPDREIDVLIKPSSWFAADLDTAAARCRADPVRFGQSRLRAVQARQTEDVTP